jgi:hypothetical protein
MAPLDDRHTALLEHASSAVVNGGRELIDCATAVTFPFRTEEVSPAMLPRRTGVFCPDVTGHSSDVSTHK